MTFKQGHIASLDMSYMNLSGTIASEIGYLSELYNINWETSKFYSTILVESRSFKKIHSLILRKVHSAVMGKLKIIYLDEDQDLSFQFPKSILKVHSLQHLSLKEIKTSF